MVLAGFFMKKILAIYLLSAVAIFADYMGSAKIGKPETYPPYTKALLFELEDSFARVNPTQQWLTGVQSFQLDRANTEWSYCFRYLVASDINGYPFIFDALRDAIALKFSILDINNDGKSELLAEYHTGANATFLDIYLIFGEPNDPSTWKLERWPYDGKKARFGEDSETPIRCRLGKIVPEKGKITVYSNEIDEGLVRSVYSVKGLKIELVEEKLIKKLER